MKQQLQAVALAAVDLAMGLIPRPVPGDVALRNCKLVSHRGEHDNRTVRENTLTAFDNASAAGVWGLECDIRWTRDDVPVICHDADTARVFGQSLVVARTDFKDLRQRLPEIPSLAEVLARYGGRRHLMLELKACPASNLEQRRRILGEMLAALVPGQHYHILALDPELFSLVDFLPADCLLPVAETNVSQLSGISLQRGYAGVAGHYLLLGEGLRRRHLARGQCIGTGFPRSRNCLLRELNRGVEWIFSNHAVALQAELQRLLC